MRKWVKAFAAAAAIGWTSPALAGGGYCEPNWIPENGELGCASSIPIAPGNDTRVNLFLLLQDRAGQNGKGLAYPDLDWRTFYGRNFLRWENLTDAWFPAPRNYRGSLAQFDGRCQTIESGKVYFRDALDRLSGADAETRNLLITSRDRLGEICETRSREANLPSESGYFVNVGANGIGDAPFGYMVYLEASASFYGGAWDRATTYYQMLADAQLDDWLTETARYMLARTALNEAIASAEDDWGWFPLTKVSTDTAQRAETGFRAYVAAYPEGRYTSSARGLIRKALWLQRDYARLGETYAEQLATIKPGSEGTARLINEIDDKLLMRDAQGLVNDPLLSATHLLMRMRQLSYFIDAQGDPVQLTKAELEARAGLFADHPELFSFLQANHAFYVEQDYRAVRDLLPDDARQQSYSPLAFSRQYLRGLALHALKDRNEEGFWRELIGGADGIWQRPAVELALARVLEEKGEVDEAFTADSPIRDGRIRRMLLGMSSGPQLLKQRARATDGPKGEAGFALFAALIRQLQHGEYRGFLEDYPLTSNFETATNGYSLWSALDDAQSPVGIFVNGEVSDGYSCPALADTVRTLSRNKRNAKALLCLGDFYRLNGLDDFNFINPYSSLQEEGELGSSDNYPGDIIHRHDFYTAIMKDASAAGDDRAYALNRAIRCYAPNNRNTCGGAGVPKEVRALWFRRLKSEYRNTEWAKGLKYYW